MENLQPDAPITPGATSRPAMGVRRFGRVNTLGLQTLVLREIKRFTGVWSQTLGAPIATALLFIAVFTLALGSQRSAVMGVPFSVFLAPGILMMTVIQNSFANTSSSILVSKVQGNIVDTLMPPLSPAELVAGFTLGGVARGLFVALGVGVVLFSLLGILPKHPIWWLAFVILGAAMMSLLGLLAGIVSQKFDQMAAITNFVITPLSFLSGTFYTTQNLPEWFSILLHLNPVFYLIDGLRFATLGVSDSDPRLGILFVLAVSAGLAWLAYRWMKSGYRLKS